MRYIENLDTGVNETEDMETAKRQTTGDVIESSILGEKRRITRSSIGIKVADVNTEGEKLRYTRSSSLNAKRKLEDIGCNVTENKKKIIEYVSDSDFEDVEVIKNKNKRKITGEKNIESESEDEEQSIIPFKSIKTRTSPKPLYDALRALSPEQEKCIRKMGFGKMVRFNLEGIHLKLGYFLVDKFDEKNMVLNLTQWSIKITPKSVHDMLGIPLGGIKLDRDCISENKYEIIGEWKRQFNSRNITGREIVEKMVDSEEGDWNFKLNFIILFVNTMAECKTRGTCSIDILQYISKDTVFDKIDWCEYVWSCLKKSKIGWKNDDTKIFYTGPITLLTLLYLDGTKWSKKIMERKRPASKNKNWTLYFLRQRVKDDMAKNGFGLGELQDPFEPTESEENDNNGNDTETDNVMIHETGPRDATDYVAKMEKQMKILSELSFEAVSKYPHVLEIVEMHTKVLKFFGDKSEVRSKITHNNLNTNKPVVADVGTNSEKHEPNEKKNEVNKKVLTEDVEICVEPTIRKDTESSPLSPVWSDPVFLLEVDRSINRENERVARNLSMEIVAARTMDETLVDAPSFSLGLTQVHGIATGLEVVLSQNQESANPINHSKTIGLAVNRGTRNANLSIHRRSPYVCRLVDVDKTLTHQEKGLWKYLFSSDGEESEELFSTVNGGVLRRSNFLSLEPYTRVDANVIDSWASVLNVEEHKRDPDKPYRLFIRTVKIFFQKG